MDDVSERFLGALSALQGVADEVTSDEAAATPDEAAMQVFWRDWPRLGSWAGHCGDRSTWTWLDRPPRWAIRSSTKWGRGRLMDGGTDTGGASRRARWSSSPRS